MWHCVDSWLARSDYEKTAWLLWSYLNVLFWLCIFSYIILQLCVQNTDITSTAGYDNIIQHLNDGKRTCKEIEDFMKARWDARQSRPRLTLLPQTLEGLTRINICKFAWMLRNVTASWRVLLRDFLLFMWKWFTVKCSHALLSQNYSNKYWSSKKTWNQNEPK